MAKFTVSLAVCLVALVGITLAAPSASKINLKLQKTLQTKSRVNIFVAMNKGTTDVLNQVSRSKFADRGDQATAVFKALSAHAAESQKDVLEMLNSPRFFAIKVHSFWITNQIYVEGADKNLIELLATMESVSSIREEEFIHLVDPVTADPNESEIQAEWGINIIKAQDAWATSNGAGAVIGIIDTGARFTHETIRNTYRGGTHAWYDPYNISPTPNDGNGHGTHVTGTIAGELGIGVAPGARWISCKGLNDQGGGSDANLIKCAEFMTCPHAHDGSNPICSLAPHAVSNSWGGGEADTFYDDVINAWHAANIIPVFAAGNSGSSCSTILSPSDSQSNVLSVGATTDTDSIAYFSSRGPSVFNTQKPDISAPGNNVRSAGHTSDTSYSSKSGTSMACPHVAGLVALLKSINPNLNFASIKEILETTADRNLSFGSQTCSGRPENQFPNYTFGYGRINALRAVQALQMKV